MTPRSEVRGKRSSVAWLAAAVFLFGAAAWLMSGGERVHREVVKTHGEFPAPGPLSWKRAAERLTLPPIPSSPPNEPAAKLRQRDPVLSALSADAQVNLVFEAAAIRDSPIGRLLLACFAGPDAQGLRRMREQGLDVTADVDRLAMSDSVMVAAGHFDNAHWDEIFANAARSETNGTPVYALGDGGRGLREAAVHRSGVLLLGPSDGVRAALDRLDGRAPDQRSPIATTDTYGEVYGVIRPRGFRGILPTEIAEKLAHAADAIELHADTRDDALIVADVSGPNATELEELGRTLMGALSLGRVKARADGDENLAALLELSRVALHGTSFRIEAGFPLALIQKQLATCQGDGGAL